MTPSQRARLLTIYAQLEEAVSHDRDGWMITEYVLGPLAELKALVNAAEIAISCQSEDCGKPLVYSGEGRRPKYCDSKCRQRAFYRRKGAASDETREGRFLIHHYQRRGLNQHNPSDLGFSDVQC
jgi:hypothetical protein